MRFSSSGTEDNIHIKCYNKYTNSWYIHIIGAIAHTNAYYGRGTAPILLDDIACSGTESSLTDRTYDSNTADCTHSDDAGARCQVIAS